MPLEALVFYLLAALTIGSALIVAGSHNLVYSAFALLGTFMGGRRPVRSVSRRLCRGDSGHALHRWHSRAYPFCGDALPIGSPMSRSRIGRSDVFPLP